jgi:hypothetical protein
MRKPRGHSDAERIRKLEKSMTSSRIELVICRLMASYLNVLLPAYSSR